MITKCVLAYYNVPLAYWSNRALPPELSSCLSNLVQPHVIKNIKFTAFGAITKGLRTISVRTRQEITLPGSLINGFCSTSNRNVLIGSNLKMAFLLSNNARHFYRLRVNTGHTSITVQLEKSTEFKLNMLRKLVLFLYFVCMF